jgi:hypothetical protein
MAIVYQADSQTWKRLYELVSGLVPCADGCGTKIDVTRDRHYVVDGGRRCARCEDRIKGFTPGRRSASDGLIGKL